MAFLQRAATRSGILFISIGGDIAGYVLQTLGGDSITDLSGDPLRTIQNA